MKLLGGLIGPIYCGNGFAKYSMGKYEEAIKLLEKSCRLDPDGARMEMTYSWLGHCYLALKQSEKALELFETAYKLYKNPKIAIQGDNDETYHNEMQKLLRAYSNALSINGHVEKATEISNELQEKYQ